MRLDRARIKNYRSLRDVDIIFGEHTALIGGNGAGKSSILKAIEKFYSTSRSCEVDDFFGRDQDQPIIIELTFSELSSAEVAAFEERVRNGKLVVTRVFDNSPSSGRYHGVVPQNPDFLDIRSQAGAMDKRNEYARLRNENPAYSDLPSVSSATAVDDALAQWEKNNPGFLQPLLDDGQFFGFQNNSRGKLQKYTSFVFVPAVREAAVDAADGKTSVIGRLLEIVVRSAILRRSDIQQFKKNFIDSYRKLVSEENMPELGALAGSLTSDLRGLYEEAEVDLVWRDANDLPVPLPMADVHLKDDGFGGPVDRQGHGLQRAFIFTLLQHLARTAEVTNNHEQAATSEDNVLGASVAEVTPAQAPTLILAIEEPELYQHPTKQRHFAEVLRALSSGSLPGVEGRTQVIFASHSPLFVSMGNAHEIRLVRRSPCADVEVKQCEHRYLDLEEVARTLERAFSYKTGKFSASSLAPRLHILGSELSEGFFANRVILVEGRSDRAALIAAGKMLGVNFEASGIAILSTEGKTNLDRPYVIFSQLGIPTFIIWDGDSNLAGAERKSDHNLALCRMAEQDFEKERISDDDTIGRNYAYFSKNLEIKLSEDLTPEVYNFCLNAACEPFGIKTIQDAKKIPEIVYQTLRMAHDQGHESDMLKQIIKSIWRYFKNKELP